MTDTTHYCKMVANFFFALTHPYLGLWINGLYYGREIGQEQAKLSKRTGVPVKELRLKKFFFLGWSEGNKKDYIYSLIGFVLGAILHVLIFNYGVI